MRRKQSLLEASIPRHKAQGEKKPPPLDQGLMEGAHVQLRAKHLAIMYGSLRHFGPGWGVVKDSNTRAYRSFLRVARYLLDYEEATGRKVNDLDYVLAHLWYWGKTCWTTRLSSSSSIQLYDAFMRLHSAQRTLPDPEADKRYERDLLKDLSRLRNESVHTIRRSLRNSGLLIPRKDPGG